MDRRLHIHNNGQEKLVYALFLILLIWLPIPLGSNREWAWSLFQVVSASMMLWLFALIIMKRVSDSGILSNTKIILFLFLCLLATQVFQVYPLTPVLIEQISPQHVELLRSQGIETSILSINRNETIEGILKQVSYVSMFFLTLILLSDRRRIRMMLFAIAVGGVFQSVLAVSQWMNLLALDTNSAVAASGTFVNKNHFAAYLNMVVACLIGLVLFDSYSDKARSGGKSSDWTASRNVLVSFLCIVVFALVITQSRGAGISFVVSMATLLISIGMNPTGRDRFGLKLLVLAIISLSVAAFFGQEIISDRILSAEQDVSSRTEIWTLTTQLIKDFLLFGVGVGNYAAAIPLYESKNMGVFINHAHNDYLELLAEQGVVGFSILAFIIFACALKALKIVMYCKDPKILIITGVGIFGVTSMLAHAVVDFNFYIPSNAAYFYVFLALMVCNSHRVKKGNYEKNRSEPSWLNSH